MFVFTAKLNKRKLLIALLLAAVVVVAGIMLFKPRDEAASAPVSLSAVVKSNAQRVEYLRSLGWLVSDEPLETASVVIPKTFSSVYDDYNAIQTGQGFDLKNYGGLEAVRYTYEVLNHPGTADRVVADIIVYRDKVIAGDVQSVSMDGFMAGLAYPAVRQ